MHRLLRTVIALIITASGVASAQSLPPKLVAPGVWFLEGDAHAGYCNSILIEMDTYLVLVDPSYPGRTRELMDEIPKLSPKPVKYVFDTHAHGDHAYGNALWTKAGATTLAYVGVRNEMLRYEPQRWQAAMEKREDVRALHEPAVQPPMQVFKGRKFVLRDSHREVDFLHLGWGHTQGDGYVWLPKEKILCTGDAAVNGPRNKLWDANVANWPKVLGKAAALGPKIVLPGHGAAGGVEIVTGQATFLRDLYAAVKAQINLPLNQLKVTLPQRDANWTRPDMSQHIGIIYAEIKSGKPAGSLPHAWQ
ncbi:MBL fold metallo-hydrolase [Granulicella paludicola]|uniref:MBL fold metallo-hydrolase n=1 Tax=Granulicella paludicola TaxID=474951 RepID=UPI0021DF6CFD|nr:MBL fold metallo-hydrolase [Granulicella paludicola]